VSRKADIDPEIRGFYFASSGADRLDGTTFERAKLTIQAAIDETTSLVPTVSPTNLAQVSAAQGGEFSETFSLPDGCQFDAQNVTIVVDAPLVCELGSFLVAKFSGCTNTQANGVVFEVDAKFSVGVRTLFTGVFGDDGIGFNLLGIGESLFMATDQMRLNGERSMGFFINCTCPDPIDINADAIIFGADDTTVMLFDPLSSSDRCIVNLSTIIEGPGLSGTTGYIANGGTLIIVQSGILQAETAIHVKNGALAVLDCDIVQGDIIIDSGGILSANIVRFTGTITNNGTLSGQIGDTLYDPIKIIALDEPDTTALITHSLTGTDGGDSRSFYTARDPKTNITGIPGDLAVRNDGVDSRLYQHRGSSSNNTDWVNLSDAKRITVLSAASFVDQVPSGTDTALQVEFGAAQGSGSDPVEIDASGNVTINQTDQYFVDISIQYGRNNAGSAAWLFFRILIDGTQSGNSIFAKLDNANNDLPVQFSGIFDFTATEVITVEFLRDSQGFDDGELMSETPTPAGWSSSPSASIRISRRELQ